MKQRRETGSQHKLSEAEELTPLTSRRDWPIVILDLGIEDIRASRNCRSTGTLASMEIASETPSPRARLITRRSQVRVLAPLPK